MSWAIYIMRCMGGLDCGLQGSDKLNLACYTPCMHLPRYRIRSRDEYLITQGDLPLNTHWTRQVQTRALLRLWQEERIRWFPQKKDAFWIDPACYCSHADWQQALTPFLGIRGIQLCPSSSVQYWRLPGKFAQPSYIRLVLRNLHRGNLSIRTSGLEPWLC